MSQTAQPVRMPMRIPPPPMFVLAYLAGYALQQFLPVTLSAPVAQASRVAGTLLLAGALLFSLSCVGLFALARTTIVPHGTAAALVIRGPYRFTRNPMYVSLTLAFLGVAALRVEPVALLLLPVPLLFLQRVVIPFEEARLRATFGAAYEDYCVRVRRWL